MKPKIFTGSTNPELAKLICAELDEPLGRLELHTFPSGEKYCQYKENIRGRDIYLIQSGYPNPNDALMELFIMIDAARRASAGRINVVMPYFAYARQDRKNKSRTPITGRLVADLLESTQINKVITMDLHCAQIQGFFSIPVDHLYSFPIMVDNFNNIIDVIVAPDTGGIKRAAALAEEMDKDFAFINKKRVSDTEVDAGDVQGDVNGKNVLIIDDLTESAGTLIEASKVCKEFGANTVVGAVTHGLLNDKGIERLSNENSLDKMIVTDTVVQRELVTDQTEFQVLSTAKIFAKAIKRSNVDRSITDLFKCDGF